MNRKVETFFSLLQNKTLSQKRNKDFFLYLLQKHELLRFLYKKRCGFVRNVANSSKNKWSI